MPCIVLVFEKIKPFFCYPPLYPLLKRSYNESMKLLFTKSTAFILFLLLTQNAFAFPETPAQPGAGLVSHLVTHENGVWSSKPADNSQKISDLLAVNGIYKLDDYALWLKKNVLYKIDPTNGQLKPAEVFSQRFGDCKDYSSLNSAVLKLLGYKPVVLAIHSGNSGHAICSFQMNDRIAFFDNNTLVLTPAKTGAEFESFLFHFYRFTQLARILPV